MKIYVDSREKWAHDGSADRHIRDWFDRHEVEWEVKKLDCGDYMLEDDDGNVKPLSVDRKKDLQELAGNLLNPNDKARFWREVKRARQTGVRLIILCEQGGGIKTYKDVVRWKPAYGRATGKGVADAIFRLQVSYGVPVLFCDKRSTARRIVEILRGKLEDNDEL